MARKVCCIGDSITVGNGSFDGGGYRTYLKQHQGTCIDLVGSQASGNITNNQHEGYGGYTADRLLGMVPRIVDAYHPDVFLVMVGTNDILDYRLSRAVDGLCDLATILATFARPAQVIVAAIPQLADPTLNMLRHVYNANLASLCDVRARMGDRIIWAEIPWRASDIGADGVHPNDTGYSMLGDYLNGYVQSLG